LAEKGVNASPFGVNEEYVGTDLEQEYPTGRAVQLNGAASEFSSTQQKLAITAIMAAQKIPPPRYGGETMSSETERTPSARTKGKSSRQLSHLGDTNPINTRHLPIEKTIGRRCSPHGYSLVKMCRNDSKYKETDK
jgi:hypothetical protein